MKARISLLALCVALPVNASSPIAQVICAPSDQMTDRLQSRMGSTIAATGLRSPEELVEVWTDDQGEWTMVIRYSSGKSCIVAIGQYWQTGGIG